MNNFISNNLIWISSFFLIFGCLGTKKENTSTNDKSKQMQIKLVIISNELEVELHNNSSKEIVIYDFDSFLGWNTVSFLLKSGDNSSNEFKLTPTMREWSSSGSSILKILPGECYKRKIKLKDGWWDIEENVYKLKDEPMQIQAVLNSPSSTEAELNKVFSGQLKSNWVVSAPPHKWLFSDHQLKMKFNIESDSLQLALSNISKEAINLWKFDNPWGWDVLSIRINVEGKEYIIERIMRHLEEPPKFNRLPPGEKHAFNINLQDGSWQLNGLPQSTKNKKVKIQIQLNIPVYPETEEYQAFFGSLRSNWVSSDPPHNWLLHD